jgi:hypothetical protein
MSEQIVVSVPVFGIVETNAESDEIYNEYHAEQDADYGQDRHHGIGDCCKAGIVGFRSFPDSDLAAESIRVKSRPFRRQPPRTSAGPDSHRYLASTINPAEPPTSICTTRLPDPGSKYASSRYITNDLSYHLRHDLDFRHRVKIRFEDRQLSSLSPGI